MGMSHWALLVGALVLVGCQAGDPRGGQGQDTGGMTGQMDSGMGRMDSGHMGMGGMNMSSMRAHMDTMMRMSPQQMQGMMARHEQMMSQMMDGMGADMRGMNMSGSPEWTALTDSVKQDLAELPSLKGQQLSTRMRAHASRVQRLIDAHEQMMKAMR
jgi:hypothetical protein